MANFGPPSIRYEGEIFEKGPILGSHGMTTDFNSEMEKQDDNTARFTVNCKVIHTANGIVMYNFSSKSFYTVFAIDLNNLEREALMFTSLLMKSFSHLQGVVAAKQQDAGCFPVSIPEDPNYTIEAQVVKGRLLELFSKKGK